MDDFQILDIDPPNDTVEDITMTLSYMFYANTDVLWDGKTLLFSKVFVGSAANMHIVIQSLESGESEVLVKGGVSGRYLPTGHIVYVLPTNDINNLFAFPFDLEKREKTGESVSVLEGVQFGAISDSGTLVGPCT